MLACEYLARLLQHLVSQCIGEELYKLLLVLKTLAYVVTGTRRRYIIPVVAELLWQPVRARNRIKIATPVFKIKLTRQPLYLADLMTDYKHLRKLRSSSKLLLTGPVFTIAATRNAHSVIQLVEFGTVYQTIFERKTFW